MKKIDSRTVSGFEYERFELESRHLGRKETLGRVRPSGGERPRATIYYLHAGDTDDRMLLDLQLLEHLDQGTKDLLRAKGVQFALPNTGLNFLLSAKDDPKRAFFEYFFEEVMPLAEEGTDVTGETRYLSGASLGGHGGLVAFLRRPESFRGVATTMGALLCFDFHSDAEFEQYARESGMTPEYAANLKGIFRGCFESYDLYRSIDPLRLLDEVDQGALRDKRILVETGSADDFGFHLAMSRVSEKLRAKGVPHQFDLIEGGRHEPAFVVNRFAPMLRFLLAGSEG